MGIETTGEERIESGNRNNWKGRDRKWEYSSGIESGNRNNNVAPDVQCNFNHRLVIG